jgi:hypothetical protein
MRPPPGSSRPPVSADLVEGLIMHEAAVGTATLLIGMQTAMSDRVGPL